MGLSVVGNILMGSGLALIGPLPILPVDPSVILSQASMVLFGVGYVFLHVTPLGWAAQQAKEEGYTGMATSLSITSISILITCQRGILSHA